MKQQAGWPLLLYIVGMNDSATTPQANNTLSEESVRALLLLLGVCIFGAPYWSWAALYVLVAVGLATSWVIFDGRIPVGKWYLVGQCGFFIMLWEAGLILSRFLNAIEHISQFVLAGVR